MDDVDVAGVRAMGAAELPLLARKAKAGPDGALAAALVPVGAVSVIDIDEGVWLVFEAKQGPVAVATPKAGESLAVVCGTALVAIDFSIEPVGCAVDGRAARNAVAGIHVAALGVPAALVFYVHEVLRGMLTAELSLATRRAEAAGSRAS